MNEPRTTDYILNKLQNEAETAKTMNPELWLDYAQILAALIGVEQIKLADLQQRVAQLRVDLMSKGDNVSAAKIKVEATTEYKEMRLQEMKLKRVDEIIRLAKIQARISGGL